MTTFQKDPGAVLDYIWDWSRWLGEDTISSRTVTAESGITKDSDSILTGSQKVRAFISGGTVGETYDVTCQITTAAGRTDERTIAIEVIER